MAKTAISTTLPRRVLGHRLRDMREHRGLTRAQAASLVGMGAQTLWRLESGRIRDVKRMAVDALCNLYEAQESNREELRWLVRESKKDGWWQSYTDALVPQVELYVGLEQSASRIVSWQSTTLPGLVQTPGYRRAMWEMSQEQGREVDREREVELISRRQARLCDTAGLAFEAYLGEAVVRHRVGGVRVMCEQLRLLAELAALPTVSLRIVPFDAPNHLGLTTKDFVYLEFPRHLNPALSEPPVVYVEGYTGNLYVETPSEVEQYQTACAALDRVALGENDTRNLIGSIVEEYRNEH
ncbi:helix-turn-helix domain-containing protein [Nocardia alni]|uniref:helix-turn-helix domain-containing protein n=1 Tax=Nocardia alni TaxID=2815723 RepID=UPI001C24B5B4|nr:helix-turn-helix transcriptional regulator [Nocardia alni]